MDRLSLYHTEVINKDGLTGYSYVNEPDGLSVKVASPIANTQGTNPEQLLGLSLATCLNATIEAEERRRGFVHQSVVMVEVDLSHDTVGYQFFVNVKISIPHVTNEEAQDILTIAKQRCPMVKLLANAQNVRYQLV